MAQAVQRAMWELNWGGKTDAAEALRPVLEHMMAHAANETTVPTNGGRDA